MRRSPVRTPWSVCALLLIPSAIVLAAAPEASRPRPNIFSILVDDMGYGDIAAHGNPVIRTPHLDKLHAQSVRLSDFRGFDEWLG